MKIFDFINACALEWEVIRIFTDGEKGPKDIGSFFKFNEILLLWKLAKEAEIEEPLTLFVSVPTLNMAISKIVMESKTNGTESKFSLSSKKS